MKRLIYFCIVISLASCIKEKIQDCEINNTFTLVFYNDHYRSDTLVIDNKIYDVSSIKGPISFNVPVEYGSLYTVDKVRVIDSTGYLQPYYKTIHNFVTSRPHCCATYIVSR